MCRLLLVKSEIEFPIVDYLKKFSLIAKNSKEYQGHGWGFAYLEGKEWKVYKNINPIWKTELSQFSDIKTKKILAHARSAFKDEGIVIENNMPFNDNKRIFIFNGELRGVNINERGRIGAEKIFNFIKRFDKGNLFEAIKKAIEIIKERTKYIRAMNMIISDSENDYLVSIFNESPEYFTMHYKKNKFLIVCSEPFPDEDGWIKVENETIKLLQ